MGQALYRKYRSKTFDEVIGQEHITKTLVSAIKAGRISHAYLFTGPRGVGKTSIARILAREVNGTRYEGEQTDLDIIEIDAASNRRIDEIRDLREKVHIAPTSSKYKVYIIDEVHMLTREAFNALLKTLEEPPAHVIFILATTESHKLPETIVSRTQRYSFKPVSIDLASKHLRSIAKKEKIEIDEQALTMLAEYGEGSLRDSLSMLDQMASTSNKIDAEAVRKQLGLPSQHIISRLVELTFAGKTSELLDMITLLRDEGNEAGILAKTMSKQLRAMLRLGQLPAGGTTLLKDLSKLSAHSATLDELEIALLEISAQNTETAPVDEGSDSSQVKQRPIAKSSQNNEAIVDEKVVKSSASFDLSMWEDVLQAVKKKNASIYTALRLATPSLSGDKLTLAFEFGLHQKKLNQAVAKDTVSTIIETICGARITIECTVDKSLVRKLEQEPPPDFYVPQDSSGSMQTISNIFGSAEVLES